MRPRVANRACGALQSGQPLESGKVAAIHVKEGQSSVAGDVILMLDSAEDEVEIAADTEAMMARRAEALRRKVALSAVASGSFACGASCDPMATRRARRAPRSRARRAGSRPSRAVGHARQSGCAKGGKAGRGQQLDASIAAQNRLIETLNERVSLRQRLIDKDVGTRTGLIDAVQALRQEQAQIAGDIGRRDQAIAAVASLDTERVNKVETFLSDNTRKMAEANRLADEKEAERAKTSSKTQPHDIARAGRWRGASAWGDNDRAGGYDRSGVDAHRAGEHTRTN